MSVSIYPVPLSGIQETLVDAKGDIVAATAADAVSRLGVGSNNQVLTADSSTATGLKWATPSSGGKVLQVVNATTASGGAETTVTTTTFTDTGLSASITPSSATSKILIIASQNIYSTRDSTEAASYLRLMRDSTNIFALNDSGGLAMFVRAAVSTNLRVGGFCPVVYLDEPATTSSITYKLQGAPPTTAGNATVVYQVNSSRSSITLMEIGA